ncbi:hypothetical protein [Nocardioides sp. SYSU D00038]|uniref:hypothetical protein n=1 Tax=Nocardioides sp. SYSU D00038 TaxID=2812554 RepID=UPI00196843A2|nr:hypothetical protein [Nocardioides sp. SYSU D00038]
MKHRTTTTRTALAIVAAALVAVPLSAEAAPKRAVTKVTITAEGKDMSGTVTSKRRACRGDRTVLLFQQVGTRGGGDDEVVAQDTTEVANGRGVWSTGNTGLSGRFYARVTRTPKCKPAVSRTITIVDTDTPETEV